MDSNAKYCKFLSRKRWKGAEITTEVGLEEVSTERAALGSGLCVGWGPRRSRLGVLCVGCPVADDMHVNSRVHDAVGTSGSTAIGSA